jgi:UDP-glucose 4-epimerase
LKNIFITGGSGYIGSHIVVSLFENKYNPIILDNFSNSHRDTIKKLEKISKKKITFYDVDLRDKKKLNLIFKKYRCDTVVHCAGYKSINESLKEPILYFDNNIISTLSLLECMKKFKIFNLIFSSSASVYDINQSLPLKENSKIGNTTNPYANSKYIIERILSDLVKSDKRWKISIARYFNPISNHFSGLIKENPKGIPNNLVPVIINVAQKKNKKLKIFGKNFKTRDGTGIRDYIHVMDLAYGHIALIKNNINKKGLKIFNFGTGKGSSVLEVIKAFEKNLKIAIPYQFVKKRDGDAETSYCSNKKAIKELNWKNKYSLNDAMINIKKIL